jgi:uncharacterized protein YegP (UPF0339 family)
MAAKFVLKKGSTGKFRFTLVATNGQVIATSEAYESTASAIKGIESVKRNARPPRSTTRPTSSLLFRTTPSSALPCPAGRSVLVAEDRSAAGARDQTGPRTVAPSLVHVWPTLHRNRAVSSGHQRYVVRVSRRGDPGQAGPGAEP